MYPLAAGLCFLPKPATFLPAEARGGHEKFGASQRGASEDILDAEAGSNSGPRGGELIIHRYNDKKPTVFSNLAGSELLPTAGTAVGFGDRCIALPQILACT